MKLQIVDGNFMKGNNIIAPEFGNKEQIECLLAYNRRLEALQDGFIVPVRFGNGELHNEYMASAIWECICGRQIEIERYMSYSDARDLVGETEYCFCGKEFEIESADHKNIQIKIVEP